MKFILFSIFLIGTGCLPKVKGQSSFPNESDKVVVGEMCKELLQFGSIKKSIQGIQSGVEQIIYLTDKKNLEEVKPEVSKLKAEVQQHILRLKSLLDSKYNDSQFNQIIHWELGPNTYSHLLNQTVGVWTLESASVEQVHTWYTELHDLPTDPSLIDLKLEQVGARVTVQLDLKTSALEICELQRDLGIVLKLKFKSGCMVEELKLLLIIKE